jgi:predicted phage terminase large subunit-like protein
LTLASPLSPEVLNRLSLPQKAEALALLERKAELIRQREAEQRREAERRRIERDFFAIRERCETLAGFVREAWHVLEPNTPLVWNWHLDAICLHLEAVTDGRINRLAINVPPGSSKSMIVSVLWPAWEWGPRGMRSTRYLTTSFAEDSVKRDTRKHRDLTLSEWYRALWPDVTLVRTGEMSFANKDTGTREGTPFGSLTAKRGDRLIIDDPHSTKTAESDAERAATVRQFREGALNRLNDQERSAIVVVMQRLHEQDVTGAILKLGLGFVVLMLPMEFEPDRRCVTAIGWSDPRTSDGELLDPRRFPRAVVDDLKKGLGSYAYAGQYQQRPAPRDGGMFKRSWLPVVDALPNDIVKWCRAWDIGATKGGGDPTAGVKVGRSRDGVFYVADVRRGQEGPAEVERTILATATQDGTDVTLRLPQDPGAAGKAYAQTLTRMLAGYPVRTVAPTGDKATRATPAAAQAEAGNVRLLRGPWNEAFIDELCTFPAGAHDDQVDALADAINELALGFVQQPAIFGVYGSAR